MMEMMWLHREITSSRGSVVPKRGLEGDISISIKLASPETIRSWSYGEVKKTETINYRTLKPERDGLFCERIFGPTKDWECYCGKYKKVRFKGIICDRCGVEVTTSRVRRERMGHIELASPVCHIWFFKGTPSYMSYILDISPKDLEKVIYFEDYVVIDPGPYVSGVKKGELLSEEEAKEVRRRIEEAFKAERISDEEYRVIDPGPMRVVRVAREGRYLWERIEEGKVIGAEEYAAYTKAISDSFSIYPVYRLLEPVGDMEEGTILAEATYNGLRRSYGDKIKAERLWRVGNPGISVAGLMKGQIISDEEKREREDAYPGLFKAGMGAEAIRELLREIDLELLSQELREELKLDISSAQRKKVIKRLRIVEAFRKSGNKPEWMVMEVIPVIPPDLRPLVSLDGGRFASSDLNELYRRLLNRNNRLKKLMEAGAPEIIIRNEKRMLQEAVDALFENGRRGSVVKGAGGRPLKSLSDSLKGKQGRFRQNLLGKRVDYSGRSVIVVDPKLRYDQCGLPRIMAIELFKPFIIRKLEEKGIAHSLRRARRAVDKLDPQIWEVLEEVVKDHPVLLNRAPTLHRLSIQAFQPVLVDGKAIRIHPLVCEGFNADFDGDQMAVHVPLSTEAQLEARILMMPSQNILSPRNGRVIASPSLDMVLGCAYLTKELPDQKGEGKVFSSPEEAIYAYELGEVALHARVKIRVDGKILDTTVGRAIFNTIVPKELGFVNDFVTGDKLEELVTRCHRTLGAKRTAAFLDSLMDMGFEYATKSGISICMDDMVIPPKKKEIIEEARKRIREIDERYKAGELTEAERYTMVVDVWDEVTSLVSNEMFGEIAKLEDPRYPGERRPPRINPISIMNESGARAKKDLLRQLSGMRGLMSRPSGEIIEFPVTSSFREGLSLLEYFISTHGARKGLADTALKTADAGYLTRRLVDVAQDVVVTERDCGTPNGIVVRALYDGDQLVQSLKERIVGRVVLTTIVDPVTDEVIIRANELITEEIAERLEAGWDAIPVRSVLTCEAKHGVCQMCFGADLATGRLVELGTAVGIIAAQSIGEPGTQLTLRTFHVGGAAKVREAESEIRAKNAGIVKYHDAHFVEDRNGRIMILSRNAEVSVLREGGREIERYPVPYGAYVVIGDGERVFAGDVIARWDPYREFIFTEKSGKVLFENIKEGLTMREEVDLGSNRVERVIVEHRDEKLVPYIAIMDTEGNKVAEYPMPTGAHLLVEDGQEVMAGDPLAKMIKEVGKTKDITTGLPRVEELFEARKPKDAATISEISGVVEIGGVEKGMRRIVVRNEEAGQVREYYVPHGRQLKVHHGDRIEAGDPLTAGPLNPHDILRTKGEKELQRYLVDEIQGIYRSEGIDINDKYIEIIIRQMMRKVRIISPGDTEFLEGELVSKEVLEQENERIRKEGGKPALWEPVLLGITKASLGTDSWISAASFQETTRVLAEAAVYGKVDELKGLKENVIVGHLIPAGTGFKGLSKVRVISPEEKELEVPSEELTIKEKEG
jgi:DNA-directed RNA polymerase subunit beta'